MGPTTRRRLIQSLGASAATFALGCSKTRPKLGSGSYVQSVTPNEATLAMVSADPSLRLRYGPAGEPLGERLPAAPPGPVRAYRLVELAPLSAYDYVFEAANGEALARGTFRTAPAASASTFSFAVLGDSGGTKPSETPAVRAAREAAAKVTSPPKGDTNQQWEIARALALDPPELILHTGDVVYPDGQRRDYREAYFHPFKDLIAAIPVYPTLGNHDVMSANGAAYLDHFLLPTNGHAKDKRSYSFDWANTHFVSLDTATHEPLEGSAQLAWLERDLAATDRTWKVVFFHKPIFSAFKKGDREELKAALVPVLERHAVDLVFCGHEHFYARFFPLHGVTWVTTGGGGRSLYKVLEDPRLAYGESVYHFVRVEVDGRSLTLSAVDATGEVFDEVVLQKPVGPAEDSLGR